MPIRRFRGPVLSLTLLAGLASACTSAGIEGKYYNTRSGEFAMELKGGRVVQGQGMEGIDMTYEVRGDSVILRNLKAGPDEVLVLMREKDGTLSAGILGSLRKK
jgi:hypothetical protein